MRLSLAGHLKQVDGGMPIKELRRKGVFSDATFYKWRAKFGDMDVSDAKRLKEPRRRERQANDTAENRRSPETGA